MRFEGALWMASFGFENSPAMPAGGSVADALFALVARDRARWVAGAMRIGFGIWTIATAALAGHGGSQSHAAHVIACATRAFCG